MGTSTQTESFYGSGQMAVEGPAGGAGCSVAAVAAAAAVAAGRRQRESTVTQRHGRGLHLSVVVPLVRALRGARENKFKLQTLKVFKLQTFC